MEDDENSTTASGESDIEGAVSPSGACYSYRWEAGVGFDMPLTPFEYRAE